jgi:hypothetical protein
MYRICVYIWGMWCIYVMKGYVMYGIYDVWAVEGGGECEDADAHSIIMAASSLPS